jgi:hypothetical protein
LNHQLPADVVAFLTGPQHAVIGWLGESGQPLTVATWYDWDDGEILLNMDATRRRLAALGVGARVSLTVLGADNWYRTCRSTVRSPAFQGIQSFVRSTGSRAATWAPSTRTGRARA